MSLAIPKEAKLSLHSTASGTYRILVNGNVHPLLVGFHSPLEGLIKVKDLGVLVKPVYFNKQLNVIHSALATRFFEPKKEDGEWLLVEFLTIAISS